MMSVFRAQHHIADACGTAVAQKVLADLVGAVFREGMHGWVGPGRRQAQDRGVDGGLEIDPVIGRAMPMSQRLVTP